MGVYRGRINCRQVATLLNSILIAEGYEQISSNIGIDGLVYKTTGVSGTDEWYLRFVDPVDRYISLGVYETYTPGSGGTAGGFVNGFQETTAHWNVTNGDSHIFDYVINANKNRVILYFNSLKYCANVPCSSVTYVGLPKRYDPADKGSGFAGICSTHGLTNTGVGWRAIKDRAANTGAMYAYDYYPMGRSFGPGNQIFFSPLFIWRADEGPRGELDGLYVAESIDQTYEAQNMDTFSKDGKNYMIVEKQGGIVHYDRFPAGVSYVMEI